MDPVYLLYIIFFSFFFFWVGGLFRATSGAYGSSQNRGQIGVTAADLHHSSQQCWIFNPLNGVWDQTCFLMDTSWFHYCWATTGTLSFTFFSKSKIFLRCWSSQGYVSMHMDFKARQSFLTTLWSSDMISGGFVCLLRMLRQLVQ